MRGLEMCSIVTFPLKNPQDVTKRYSPLGQSEKLSVFWVKNDVF